MIDKARAGEIKIAEKSESHIKTISSNLMHSNRINRLFHKRITCLELRTEFLEADECEGVNYSDYSEYYRYDVSKYVSDTNVYYFAGDHDPATPIKNTIRHFNIMGRLFGRISKLSLIKVNLAGHNPLIVDLSDCNTRIWEEIVVNDGIDLRGVLKQCSSFAYMKTISK